MPTAIRPATSPFASLHAQLSQAVLACRADSAPKAVHSLRTTTRRLEGLLHKTLEDHRGAKALHKTSRKTLRHLKKVRQLAGAVRDLDVHQKLAKKVLENMGSFVARRQALEHDHQQLHRYLTQKREQAAEVLASGLAKREIRLERALERTAATLEELSSSSIDPLTTARHWVQRSARRLHELNAESLHDFRKQTKLARYVSEMQPPSPTARAFTRSLLAVQDAIGAWHDLDLLHQEAKAVCGKNTELTNLLAARVEEALETALSKTRAVLQPQPAKNHASC